MSQDELYAVTARVVDEFTSAAMLFTALDISNSVKKTLPDARHREISPIVRDLFDRRGMGAYTQTLIDVVAAGQKPAKAYLYHLPEQSPILYDDAMRSQLARPPQAIPQPEVPTGATSTDAHVRIGKDGRARVPGGRCGTAGTKGARALVRTDAARPKLTIVAADAAAPAGPPAGAATSDVYFAATDGGQPLNYEHPSLLHVPRSLIDLFGADPNLVARVDGASVVIVRK